MTDEPTDESTEEPTETTEGAETETTATTEATDGAQDTADDGQEFLDVSEAMSGVFEPSEPDELSLKFAKPIDFSAGYGEGANRTLVLGGGGIFFVAWQVSYLSGLKQAGVDLGQAEIVVGTSAGSIVASILTSGLLDTFGLKVNLLGKLPTLVNAMAPAQTFVPSQIRALEKFQFAENGHPETIRDIGHAALAAETPSPAETRRSLGLAMGPRTSFAESLRTTAVDCYTGERLVATAESGLTPIQASAASSAVPGIFSPQPLLDRFCMDGGVSGSGTHCDLVAGAQRTIVISLGSRLKTDVAMMTVPPDGLDKEVAGLEAAGTKIELCGPSALDPTRLMDPSAINEAMELGASQAEEDAPTLEKFWNE